MKMLRIFLISLISLLSFNSLIAQNSDEVLVTIGDEEVTRGEFERIYLKNNQMVADTDKKSLEEYFDLFITYKLKVVEAKNQGLHETKEFKQELNSYKKQLIQPQLVDKETEDEIIREAYERLKYEVSASHILIGVPEKATPEDTTMLYNKTLKIRERILDGEPFQEVARATSDDPSVKRNGGKLGYFTAFQMVYPFESAAFNTEVGKISMPIRTRFGYHIIKVHDKRPTMGQVKTAHIMIGIPQNATEEQKAEAKDKIDSIYKEVLNNEDFSELARKNSQDPGSAKNGGELPWFGSGRMVPEFEKVAFSLEQTGETSEPFKTQFGWHIVKLLDKKTVGTFKEMYPEIKSKVAKDERGRISRKAFVEKLKDKYNFSLDTNTLETTINIIDSSVYKGNWMLPRSYANNHLFEFADEIFTIKDLHEYITKNHNQIKNASLKNIPNIMLNQLIEKVAIEHEEKQLINKNPDFNHLLKEYYDGILLFEIMDRNVWKEAANDEEGLKVFYEQNIDNYKWDKLINVKIYRSADAKTAEKAKKKAKSWRGRRLDNESFINKWFVSDGDTLLTITETDLLPNDSLLEGYENWDKSMSSISKNEDGASFVKYISTKNDVPKPFDQVKGKVIADYQEFLEEKWVKSLKEKYEVKVNNKVFESISSNLN
ncbi:MAG: peptidylprolyl isomerase [Bacteroidales bacterium]